MKRIDLIKQIITRKKQLKITVENLAKLSGVSVRSINRLLKNEDVKLSTVEQVTNFLGLDFAGNEQVRISILKKQRAHEKALFLASIVQSTSALKELADDVAFREEHETFDIYEGASRIHHRAVQIHPYKKGNGRWSRMLANIYLRQHGSMPAKWQEDLLSKENAKRDKYI